VERIPENSITIKDALNYPMATPYKTVITTTQYKTVSAFKNRNSRSSRIPSDFDFKGINKMNIIKKNNTIINESWWSMP